MVFAGFRKHVIPAVGGAAAWDLCFLEPSILYLLLFYAASYRFHPAALSSAGMT
jgi:hypothetical protein